MATRAAAANVRAELGRQRRTRRDLAAAMGVDEHRVSKRVRGLVPFSADELAVAAEFLQVSVDDLTGASTSATRRPAAGVA